MPSFGLNLISSLIFLGFLSLIAVPSDANIFNYPDENEGDTPSTTTVTTPPPSPTSTPKPDEGEELKKILQKLAAEGQDRSDQAHEKLRDMKKDTNPYSKMLVLKLNYLELLISRSSSYSGSVGNPFMKQLIEYNIEDLSLMNNVMDTLMLLFDQNFDQSVPVLSDLINDLEKQAGIDIAWLNTNNHRGESQKISDQMTKLGGDLEKLKDLDFFKNPDAVYAQVAVVVESITAFQGLVYKTQQQFNQNPAIYHNP